MPGLVSDFFFSYWAHLTPSWFTVGIEDLARYLLPACVLFLVRVASVYVHIMAYSESSSSTVGDVVHHPDFRLPR